MKTNPVLLAAGAVALAIGGIAGAQIIKSHTLTIRLPDGGVERILYTGDAPPKVAFVPLAAPLPVFWLQPMVVDEGPLEMMQRLSAEMDSLSALPADASGYSFVSTASGAGVCMRTVEITSTGHGQPHVVSHTSGDCGPAHDPVEGRPVEGARPSTPGVIQASYVTPLERRAPAGS